MRSGTTHLLRPLTAAGLLVLVGVPLLFIVLQAIFPQLGSGSLGGAFSRILPSFSDPQILDLTRNTLLLGLCVSVASAIVGVPLGVARRSRPLPLPFTSARQHVPLDEYKSNLRRIVAHFQALGVGAIVVITPPPIIFGFSRPRGPNQTSKDASLQP